MGFGGAAGRLVELGERQAPRADPNCARLAPSRWRARFERLPPRERDWTDRASAGVRREDDAGRRDRNDVRPDARGPRLRRCAPARCPRPASPPRAPRAARYRTKRRPSRPDRRQPPAPVEGLPLRPRRRGADRAPTRMQFGLDAPKRHPMLPARASRASAALNAAAASPRRISRWDFQKSGWAIDGSVAEVSRAPVRLIDQFARAFDLAQLPHRHGEDGHRYGAGVVAEAFPRLPVAFRVASVERPLAMGPRLEEIAGKVAGQPRPRGRRRLPRPDPRPPLLSGTSKPAPAPTAVRLARWPRSIDRGTPRSAPQSCRSLAASSAARAKAALVSSAAKPLAHIIAWP